MQGFALEQDACCPANPSPNYYSEAKTLSVQPINFLLARWKMLFSVEKCAAKNVTLKASDQKKKPKALKTENQVLFILLHKNLFIFLCFWKNIIQWIFN